MKEQWAHPPVTTFIRAIYRVGLWMTEREAWASPAEER